MPFGLNDAFDISMMDSIVVNRRPLVVDAHGRTTVVAPTATTIQAVVAMAGPDDLDRLEEADIFGRVITVVTRYKIQGQVTGFKADVITWRGDNYLVKTLDPYPQFGDGWTQAICGSVDLVDAAT